MSENNITYQLEYSGKSNYDYWIKCFNNQWNSEEMPKPSDILDFLESKKNDKRKYSLNTLYIAKCAMIYSINKALMRIEDYTTIHVFKTALKSFKIIREKTKVRENDLVTLEEMKIIEKKSNKRNFHLTCFLFMTGIRISELTEIRVTDCRELKDGSVEILINGKGRRKRFVLITKELHAGIRGHFKGVVFLFETLKNKQYVTSKLQEIIRRLGKSILGRRLHPHLFRHTFITNQMKAKESVANIAEYVGNTPRIIFDVYFHDIVNRERMLSNVNIFENLTRKKAA